MIHNNMSQFWCAVTFPVTKHFVFGQDFSCDETRSWVFDNFERGLDVSAILWSNTIEVSLFSFYKLEILETPNFLPFFPSRLPCYQVDIWMCHEKLYAIHIVFLNCQPEFLNYIGEIWPKWVLTFGRSYWPKVNACELYLAGSFQGYPTRPYLAYPNTRTWYWIWRYGYPWKDHAKCTSVKNYYQISFGQISQLQLECKTSKWRPQHINGAFFNKVSPLVTSWGRKIWSFLIRGDMEWWTSQKVSQKMC